MTLSATAVRRPVLAAVGAIILCVIGFASFLALSVRELPNVDPPQVSISTSYRGASAEVVEERITQVIERQVSGIQGIDRVNSTSRDGQSRVNITFTLERNLDEAANDVRDAVARVSQTLPDQADAPQIAKATADSQPIMILSLTSKTLNRLQLSDYADRFLVERLSTIPGVAQVGLFGNQNYAMRIWLDPSAMAARGVTVDDVQTALNSQNVELPAGALESPGKDYTIRVARQYGRPEQFALLPISPGRTTQVASTQTASSTGRAANSQAPTAALAGPAAQSGAPSLIRLGDVARIEEGPDERRRLFRANGQDQIALFVVRQSQANDLDIAKAVRSAVDEVNKSLPGGTKLKVSIDYTVFTREAIREVWITMAFSMALVALVNYLFLGSWRAALIPSIVAPICILSSFIALAPLGFSINLLTLLALVLAIGLVVDDAIVVVENIQRRIDEGEPPEVAAQRGAGQVFFAVVATTLVLIAVFAPLMFLPGYIGRLFVELAVAVAAAVAFSAFLALSLSPMLASKLLRKSSQGGFVARAVDRATEAVRRSYRNSLDLIVGGGFALVALVMVLVLAVAAAGLFFLIPRELVPNEDRGRVDVSITGPEGTGYDATRKILVKAEPILASYVKKGIADRYTLAIPRFGAGQFNSGSGNLVLVDWSKRKVSADEVADELNRKLRGITAARVIASVRGPFQRGGGGGGGSNVDLIAVGNDYASLARWMGPIMAAAEDNPGLVRPRLDYEPTSPRLLVRIDRDKAAALGVSVQGIGSALETMFGSKRVTTYVKEGQEYDVLLQTELENRRNEADLEKLYVRTGAGALVPLSAVVTTEVRGDTPDRRRVDRLRAVTLTADLAPGYTVAEAVTFLQDQARRQNDSAVSIKWGSQAKDYLEASNSVTFAFAMALLLVFLVLAAQFESWIHPAIIMLTVPLAALGGLFGLLIGGSTINTYSQIGLIILIGIAAKNGILIVEFANQLRDQGRTVREAVIEAASLRLRPIIMTSIAAAMGALPLILASGPGAGSRRTIGLVIFTGAIFATLLTLFVVPVIYNLLARFTRSPEETARRIEKYEAEEAEGRSTGSEEPQPGL